MLDATVLLILLLPLAPLVILFRVTSDAGRRKWLLVVALSLFVNLVWYVLLHWTLHLPEIDASKILSITVLSLFYKSAWVAVAYVVIIAVLGYSANRLALGRIERNKMN